MQYYQSENEDLVAAKDQVSNEKNELMIKYSKQVESERNEKRQHKTDAEKLNIRVRYLEEEVRKERMRKDQLQTEHELVKSERENYLLEIRKKDDTIHYLQRKIVETEEGSRVTEQRN